MQHAQRVVQFAQPAAGRELQRGKVLNYICRKSARLFILVSSVKIILSGVALCRSVVYSMLNGTVRHVLACKLRAALVLTSAHTNTNSYGACIRYKITEL